MKFFESHAFQGVMDVLLIIMLAFFLLIVPDSWRENKTTRSLGVLLGLSCTVLYGIVQAGLHFYHLFW